LSNNNTTQSITIAPIHHINTSGVVTAGAAP